MSGRKTRLIDANALKDSVHAHDYVMKDCLNSTGKGMFTVGIMQAIDEQPTIDAEPVRHGKWIPHEDEYGEHYGYDCSECGEWYVMPYGKLNHCPNCGCRMDKE